MHTSNHNNEKQLSFAYNQMMATISHTFERRQNSETTLQNALIIAKNEVLQRGEITPSDAQDICEYIKHDINEAAEYMMEASEEFCDWLMLDINVVERKVVEMFLAAADDTRLEIKKLCHHYHSPRLYTTGDTIGYSTLRCTQCSQYKHIKTITVIRACKCGNAQFVRTDTKRG